MKLSQVGGIIEILQLGCLSNIFHVLANIFTLLTFILSELECWSEASEGGRQKVKMRSCSRLVARAPPPPPAVGVAADGDSAALRGRSPW